LNLSDLQQGDPSADALREVANIARDLPEKSGWGLDSIYHILAALVESAPLSRPIGELEEARSKFNNQTPALVRRIIEVADNAFLVPTSPENKIDLERARVHFEESGKKLESLGTFPETKLLQHQLNHWLKEVRNRIGIPKIGDLQIEIIANSSLEENWRNGGGWSGTIPLRIMNCGDEKIEDICIRLTPIEGEMPPVEEICITELESGTTVYGEFSFEVGSVVKVEVQAEYRWWVSHNGEQKKHLQTLPPKDAVTSERERYQIKIGLVADEPKEMVNWYVPDRPLISDSEWKRLAHGSAPDLVKKLITQLVSVENGTQAGRVIAVRGLRRTGKTSILLQVLKGISESKHSRQFVVVYIDLLLWLVQNKNAKRGDIPLDALLWQEIVTEIAYLIQRQEYELSDELTGYIHKQSEHSQMAEEVGGVTYDDFVKIVRGVTSELSARLIVVIDEADSFGDPAFNQNAGDKSTKPTLPIIGADLRDLVRRLDVTFVLVHELLDATWEQDFYNTLKPLPERTSLLTEEETRQLVHAGRVILTDLAHKAVWHYTGGYPALIQLLCFYLVDKIQADKTRDGNLRSIVTGSDVRAAVDKINTSQDWSVFVDYLHYGFSQEEIRFMVALVMGATEKSTWQIKSIELNGSQYINLEKIQSAYNTVIAGESCSIEDIRKWVSLMMTKEILRKNKATPKLEWRVGWLHELMQQRAPEILEQVRNENRSG
jgi:hypothetical protein